MRILLHLSLLLVLTIPVSQASILSYQGTFSQDDQVQLFMFSIPASTVVTFQSYGYGGGTNGAGMVIPPGGFDTFFTFFSADGTQIGSNDDGCGAAHFRNGSCLDAYATPFLTAGSYTLALTESGNDPNGNLSDGFTQSGNGNFTATGACTMFCDTFGGQSDGNFAVDISGANLSTTVPEPSQFIPVLSGLFILALARNSIAHRFRKYMEPTRER